MQDILGIPKGRLARQDQVEQHPTAPVVSPLVVTPSPQHLGCHKLGSSTNRLERLFTRHPLGQGKIGQLDRFVFLRYQW